MASSILGVAVSVLVVWAFTRRRRGHVSVALGEPLTTLHGSLSKKRTKHERAALQAASDILK